MDARIEAHRRYWDDFYRRRSGDVPKDPSDFAVWVADQIPDDQLVVELGFGTARDAFYFVQHGHALEGFDFAESAVSAAIDHAQQLPGQASFSVLDLCDADAVQEVAARLRERGEPVVVYGRFLIHSLDEAGRHHLLDLAADTRAQLFLEFRTGNDAGQEHLFGDDHYRTYLDPEVVVTEIQERGGEVKQCVQGHGFAVYKSEDPHVARIEAHFVG
jgi:hypothetical protein